MKLILKSFEDPGLGAQPAEPGADGLHGGLHRCVGLCRHGEWRLGALPAHRVRRIHVKSSMSCQQDKQRYTFNIFNILLSFVYKLYKVYID